MTDQTEMQALMEKALERWRAKGTPGPWNERWDGEGGAFVTGNRQVVANMMGADDHKANAALIAAAPYMAARIKALEAKNGRLRGEIASIFDWQPIETAPRDGTPFFTLSADAANDPRESFLGLKSTPVLVMAWLRTDKQPYPVDEYGEQHDFHCYEPTHWSPMDAALRAARAALKGGGE